MRRGFFWGLLVVLSLLLVPRFIFSDSLDQIGPNDRREVELRDLEPDILYNVINCFNGDAYVVFYFQTFKYEVSPGFWDTDGEYDYNIFKTREETEQFVAENIESDENRYQYIIDWEIWKITITEIKEVIGKED